MQTHIKELKLHRKAIKLKIELSHIHIYKRYTYIYIHTYLSIYIFINLKCIQITYHLTITLKNLIICPEGFFELQHISLY